MSKSKKRKKVARQRTRQHKRRNPAAKARTSTLSDLMLYRPVSQMLNLFVLPEVNRRVVSGQLVEDDLPLHVHTLRVIQPGAAHVVEINEQVQLTIDVVAKRPIEAEELVLLGDIDAEKCVLHPPLVDGKARSYFLVQSSFLNLQTMFDFTQNSPSGLDMTPAPPMRYPIAEFIRAREFLQAIRPVEKFRQLAGADWPPAPGYYPNVVAFLHKNPESLQDATLADAVVGAYGRALWTSRLEVWAEAKFFPGRLEYVRKAIDEYLEGDWVSSTYVIVPQFEGIIKDYLKANGMVPSESFKEQMGQLRKLIFSRKVLMFPREVLELILESLETGTFWRKTRTINDPRQEVNRHGIAHGKFTGFESRDMALKYLVLLDGLALLLLHDKMLTDQLK